MTELLEEQRHDVAFVVVDPEALIEEARRRQRRRRSRLLGVVVGLAGAAAVAYALVQATRGGAPAVERVPRGPVVAVRSFAHHGRLAFVSHGKLWLLDGNASRLKLLPTPGGGFTASQPVFSSDGKWLAYLEQRQNPVTQQLYSRLWIARADGTEAHVVPGLQVESLFGWSPTADVIAVAAGPEHTRQTQSCPCFSPRTLRIVIASGASRILARGSWLYGASWSPDGTQIAAAWIGMKSSRLFTYRVATGTSRLWLTRLARQTLNGMNGIVFSIAGWWPRFGLGTWVFGDGAIRNNDETPLDAVAAPGAIPRLLGQTLSDGTTDAVAASSNGELAIVTDHGGGRSLWQGKRVEVCTQPSSPCTALPHTPGSVTVDPAWSPGGKTLAYVQAPDFSKGSWSQKRLAEWFADHRVLLYDAGTHHVRRLPAATGATAITWSHDGTSLLYVRDDALWLLPSLQSKAIRIAGPLFPPLNWPQYYAQIAWSAQFAWSAG